MFTADRCAEECLGTHRDRCPQFRGHCFNSHLQLPVPHPSVTAAPYTRQSIPGHCHSCLCLPLLEVESSGIGPLDTAFSVHRCDQGRECALTLSPCPVCVLSPASWRLCEGEGGKNLPSLPVPSKQVAGSCSRVALVISPHHITMDRALQHVQIRVERLPCAPMCTVQFAILEPQSKIRLGTALNLKILG